jgi:hypothetical protein
MPLPLKHLGQAGSMMDLLLLVVIGVAASAVSPRRQ